MIYSVIYRSGDVHWIEEVTDVGDLGKLIEKITNNGSEGEKSQEIGRLMEVGDEFRGKTYRIECRKGSMIRK
jgi:hypothetical protein